MSEENFIVNMRLAGPSKSSSMAVKIANPEEVGNTQKVAALPTPAEVYRDILFRLTTDNMLYYLNTAGTGWIKLDAKTTAEVLSVNGQTGEVELDAADVGADAAGTAAGLVGALTSDSLPNESDVEGTTITDALNTLLVGGAQSWQQNIRSKVESLVGITATATLTTSGAGDLQTAINALVEGDVLEIQTNATYSPITMPTDKKITILAGVGFLPKITGQYGITLVDGCRDILVAGIILQTCTTGSVNDKGAAITFAHQAKVQDITFYDCTIKLVASGSGVMLSYHQSISGDLYYNAPTLAEMSERVAFVSCCFNRAGPDGAEGANLAVRGVKQFMAEDCTIDGDNDGRGIQLQDCIDVWIAHNVVINCRDVGTGNGEAIKLDSIGTPVGYRISGAVIGNRIRNAIEGIDIDDVTSMTAVYGNIVSDCLAEGISLDGGSAPAVGYAGIVGNVCFRCANGIRLESGSVAELSGNVCFGNTSNNYLIENGYSLDATNTTSPSDSPQAGDEFGPASAVDANLVAFDGTTGRRMKDSGKALADLAIAATYTGNDVPGAGSNTLTAGNSRIWNRVSDGKSFLLTNAAGTYRLVELTDYA